MPSYIDATQCCLFHRIREAITSGKAGFYFIPGEINPADILSKHLGYA
jgi:hypothetical protein